MVDFDITSCFESINTQRLLKFIKAHITHAELRRLIEAWFDVETAVVERHGPRRKRAARGILQGGILSPLIANIYLDHFDKAALHARFKLVRYADDGIVCCKTQRDAAEAMKRVRKLLAKLDLKVNPRKTAIQHVEKGFDYLGERLFLKHRGYGTEAVFASSVASNRRLQPATLTYQHNEDMDVWEPST
jgi:retron-type reverse transcriptase